MFILVFIDVLVFWENFKFFWYKNFLIIVFKKGLINIFIKGFLKGKVGKRLKKFNLKFIK